jgi:PHD/YefM family antitoxin component YafN of YafNO toxin-antitoxin module
MTNSETRFVLSSEAKAHFSELIEDVFNNSTRYIVKRFGKARAVIIPLPDFEQLRLAEQEGLLTTREVRASYKVGQPATDEELDSLLGQTS